jgi:dTDP-4-dehydrorhamnose 3,5-epimerase
MIFRKVKIEGPRIIEPEHKTDPRGYFSRIFGKDELAQAGIDFSMVQANISFTKNRGMLRGLHFQKEPKWESKIVQCLRGKIYNAAVDLRKDSPTFGEWFSEELSEESGKMLYTPKGFANGFQALTDNVELLYFMSEYYSPEHATGIRWNDPKLNIPWPVANPVLSERDKNLPLLDSI